MTTLSVIVGTNYLVTKRNRKRWKVSIIGPQPRGLGKAQRGGIVVCRERGWLVEAECGGGAHQSPRVVGPETLLEMSGQALMASGDAKTASH